jgi:hypothetical protein
MHLPRRRFFSSLIGLSTIFSRKPKLKSGSSGKSPFEGEEPPSAKFRNMLRDYLAETPPERRSPDHIEFLENTIEGWQTYEQVLAGKLK